MKSCRAALVAVFCQFVPCVAWAGPGHIWLSEQIQADGRIVETGNPQATEWQAAAEAGTALYNAGLTGPALTATRNYLQGLVPDSTELLSRQIVAGVQSGSDVQALG